MSTHVPKLHFPGTVHYINPSHNIQDEDTVLISEFGRAVRWVGIALCIYVLLVAINLINSGIHILGYDAVSKLVTATSHPLLVVLLGVLLTFTVQSSTVVTTLTVATVGAGLVPVDMAAMLIMGSNIGTCATAQIVAFGFYRDPCSLHRSIAAAMTHWWFNVLSVAILLPIELIFHPLARLAGQASSSVDASAVLNVDGLVGRLIRPLTAAIVSALPQTSTLLTGTLCITLAVVAIIFSIHAISRLMLDLTASGSHHMLRQSAGRAQSATPLRFVLAGLGLTMMSQSSSATICSALPFAGTGNLALRKMLGIVIGANLGTTLTAVFAAIAVPGDVADVAMQAALIHVLFNLVGLLVVLLIQPLGKGILQLSEYSAKVVSRYPLPTFVATMASYTLIPLGIITLAAL